MSKLDNYKKMAVDAIGDFHRSFYPEVIATYLGASKEGRIAIFFRGHPDLTYGMHDFFEDFLSYLNKYAEEEFIIEERRALEPELRVWIIIYAPSKIAKQKEESVEFIIIDPNKCKIEEIFIVKDVKL